MNKNGDQHPLEDDGPDPPAWVETLLDLVANCIEPHVPMGPLGYWISTEEGVFELVVYPTPVEFVGGAVDGDVGIPGFSLDVQAIQAGFERIDGLDWQAHSFGDHDLDGPHISISGIFQGREVWLRVLSEPPDDIEPGMLLDTSSTG